MVRVLATKLDLTQLLLLPGGAPGEESSVRLGPFLSLPPSLDLGWNGPLALGWNWAKAQENHAAPEKAAAASGLGRTHCASAGPTSEQTARPGKAAPQTILEA